MWYSKYSKLLKGDILIMRVDFFHDVLCAYCYALSPKLRELKEAHPDLEIVHHCYALFITEDDMIAEYGSRENTKKEIVGHWEMANKVDKEHRMNPQAMMNSCIEFPTSMPGLRAVKAAELSSGQDAAWDVFDALQKAFFTDTLDIGDEKVIESIVSKENLDFQLWSKYFYGNQVNDEIAADFKLVTDYDVDIVPFLVFDGKLDDEHVMRAPASLKKMNAFVENLKNK